MDSSVLEAVVPGTFRNQDSMGSRHLRGYRRGQGRSRGQKFRGGDSRNVTTFGDIPPLLPGLLSEMESSSASGSTQNLVSTSVQSRFSFNREHPCDRGSFRAGFKRNVKNRSREVQAHHSSSNQSTEVQVSSVNGNQSTMSSKLPGESEHQCLVRDQRAGRTRGKQVFPGGRGRGTGYRKFLNDVVSFKENAEGEDEGLLQTLRERLKKQLESNTYECMICCQVIQANQWVWTCSKCYHMFHMNRTNSSGCITQWAAKSGDPDGGWRCPSCQNVSLEFPKEYRCFCGKRMNPPTRRFPSTPHSCGGSCGRRRGYGCPHPCTEECHPGPCCACPAMVTHSCDCGAETRSFRCGTPFQFKCQKICGKVLGCGSHTCNIVCHSGSCGLCEEKVHQKCYCGLEEREVLCTAENSLVKNYSCGAPCNGKYDCGIHDCTFKCHQMKEDGTCGPCPLSPALKQYCSCGSTKISAISIVLRKTCSDPIPTCGKICNKVLECGPKNKPHRCKQLCHEGPCPPCPDNTSVLCRCKSLKKTVPCIQAITFSESNPLLCEKRCRKQKTCQNHRCQSVCCVDTEHVCLQVCNKKLDCGNHFCDRLCHVGQCPKCLQASFEEQYCLCGKTVREPPIPCGTPLPGCDAPCSRTHPCSHPPLHTCHADPECPPCTVLTEKYCYGKHELRANIPCYLNEVSCGKPCNAPLPCGIHNCKRICHAPPCVLPGDGDCKQPCPVKRTSGNCDHPCSLPCHGTSPCPKSDCTARVQVTCPCLRRKGEMKCVEVERAYRRRLAIEMADLADEKPTSAERRALKRSSSMDKFRCLHCDAECRLVNRNKMIAEALNIKTDSDANRVELNGVPALAASMYTDYLKSYLKRDFKHVQDVENVLLELVQTVANLDDGSCQTHSFPPMNAELRRVIHEYATYFKIETRSYDLEPLRNVVATAKKGECCLPLVFLTASDPKAVTSCSTALAGLSLQKAKTLPATKTYSWNTESGMHQLKSVGKVIKRGFADAARETK